MSYTEVRTRGGLQYGGMPHDVILKKLEETDPGLVGEIRGLDEFHAMGDNYDDYVRSEIIDWSPDKPYLESDQPRRDPALSRSILNLHYNGTRGNFPELPRHPELFYGFMDKDPRGTNNTPRFEQIRGQMTSRAADLTVRMGDNDDHALAERPWTGQSISYDMKEIQRRLKHNTRVFSVQKEGRPWSRNVVTDPLAARAVRAAAMDAADESLATPSASLRGAAPERFAAGDQGSAAEAWTDGVRGADAGHFSGADVAPWRHTTGDADLGVQKYGQKRGAGRSTIATAAQGGARINSQTVDQDWTASKKSRSTNRQTLAATMALAARHGRAVRSGAAEQDHGRSYETAHAPGSGLAPARDVARMYRYATEDQTRRPLEEIQDGEGGALGAAAGLTPAVRPERAIRASEAHAAPNSHLTNVENIVAGLREGTAAARRRIAGAVVADGARHLSASENEAPSRRGEMPGADLSRVTKMSDHTMTRAAASEGLVVHAYGMARPSRPEAKAATAMSGDDRAAWRPQLEALPMGQSRAAGEWRSATQGHTVIGDNPNRLFGLDAVVDGYHGSAPMGVKSLRAGTSSASDAIGGSFGDAFSD